MGVKLIGFEKLEATAVPAEHRKDQKIRLH